MSLGVVLRQIKGRVYGPIPLRAPWTQAPSSAMPQVVWVQFVMTNSWNSPQDDHKWTQCVFLCKASSPALATSLCFSNPCLVDVVNRVGDRAISGVGDAA